MLTGGCLCGAMRYESDALPFHETICHCSMCRRATGAPMVAWFSVPRAQLRWLDGEPARYASSADATRTFCPRCGTPLTFEDSHYPDEIDVTVCSLDAPVQMVPRDHTHTATQLEWVRLADSLPRYRGARSEE